MNSGTGQAFLFQHPEKVTFLLLHLPHLGITTSLVVITAQMQNAVQQQKNKPL